MPGIWAVRVFGTSRLAQHTYWNQSSTTLLRASLQNPITYLWTTPATSLFDRRGHTSNCCQKERQRYYYDQHVKPLPPIASGDTVWMRLPGQSTWSAGTCTGTIGPRSYAVRMGERVFRRNRRQLIQSDKQPLQDHPLLEPTPPREESVQSGELPDQNSTTVGEQQLEASPQRELPLVSQSPSPIPPRRSDRVRRPPQWSTDYVPY